MEVQLSSPLDKNQRKIKKIIIDSLPYLESFFCLPKKTKIVVCSIPAQETNGNNSRTLGASYKTAGNIYVCEVDDGSVGYFDPYKIIETLAHEFTHIQQMYQGTLAVDSSRYYWRRSGKFETFEKTRDFEEYLNFPWEVEARTLASKFTYAYAGEILNNTDKVEHFITKIKRFFIRRKKRV